MAQSAQRRKKARVGEENKLFDSDKPAHDWYRFVLSFPPHLVRTYLERFAIASDQTVLDPFCGTGTTLVECKKLGIASIGIEANPVAAFASSVKTNWSPHPAQLLAHSQHVFDKAVQLLQDLGYADEPHLPLFDPPQSVHNADESSLKSLSAEQTQLLLSDSISPIPLHKCLTLLECLTAERDPKFHDHELLAFTKTAVNSASNLHFGPEVGVTTAKQDAPVLHPWLTAIRHMAADLEKLHKGNVVPAFVHPSDSRNISELLAPCSIDAVITSPPYPNEKDYTRTTRLESVLLGFIHSKAELRDLKRGLLRSNTRGVYKGDDDDTWIADHPQIQQVADDIEKRRIELGKTSGFERMYHKVTRLYFGGMARHLAELRDALKPGAQLAYVVGDQASYLRIMIRTGKLLADIAQNLGYELIDIDLFRTRLATATKDLLREEVVLLRWPGPK